MESSKRLLRIADAVDNLGDAGRQIVQTELDRDHQGRVHQYRYEWGGLITGTALAAFIAYLSYLLIASGSAAAATGGTVLGVADLASLVGVFIYGTQKRDAALPQKPDKPREIES